MTSTGQTSHNPTLSQADTPANHSQQQDNATENTTHDTSGPCSLNAFAYYDPDTHCWKTSQGTLLSDLEALPVIWPRSGMTSNGTAYQRPPSVPLTDVTGCSYWPTPRAGMGTDTRNSHAWLRPDGQPQNLENRIATENPQTIGQPVILKVLENVNKMTAIEEILQSVEIPKIKLLTIANNIAVSKIFLMLYLSANHPIGIEKSPPNTPPKLFINPSSSGSAPSSVI